MDKRIHVIASGRVQKASFRIFVDRIAFELDLKGTVRNLQDGTVEMICEGPEERLNEFARTINIRKYPIRVDDLKTRISDATGEFKDFDIIKDGQSDSDLEGKIDLGTVFLQDISTKQDEAIKAAKTMDSHVQGMDSHIQGMDSNMGHHFDRLDRKYDKFGKTMKGMARELHNSGKDARATRTHMKSMASDIKAIRNAATTPKRKKGSATA